MNPRLAIVIAFAAITRLGYFVWYRAHDPLYGWLLHDARQYDAWARALAAGEPWQTGAFFQAPGYPVLLGLLYRIFGAQPPLIYALQLLAGLVTILLVARIATRAYDDRAGLTAALLAAGYGSWTFHETKLLSASLASLLACLAVERLQIADGSGRDLDWSIAGAVLGLSAVVRPDVLLLVPLVAGWIVWRARRPRHDAARIRLRHALLLAGLCLACVLPVTVRNVIAGGGVVPVSSNGGIVFWAGNNQAARGWIATPGLSGSIATQRAEARAIAEREAGRRLNDAEVSRHWLGRGLDFVAGEPGRWLVLEGRKLWLALDDHEHGLEYDPQLDENPWRHAMPLSFAMILALAAARVAARHPLEPGEVPILLTLVGALVTLLGFYVAARFRLPATGPLIAVAGGGGVLLWDTWREGTRAHAIGMLGIGLLAGLFSFAKLPPDGAAVYRARSASSVCDVALAHRRSGATELALELYDEATRRDPAYAFAHLDRGTLLGELGREAEAREALERATRLAPELAEAHAALGSLHLDADRFALAVDSFAVALRLDPSLADVANNLVGSLLTLGREDEAIRVWREMRARGQRAAPMLESWMERHAAGVE